jgi:hypothetical protein
MTSSWKRLVLAMALGTALVGLATAGRADPLLRQGIGLQTCEKLAPQLKPGAGLDHLPNALLFYWFQGYISAANIHLLNEYTDYVDAGAVDEATITKLVADFCKSNPDKRPVNALDKFIQDATKIEVKESDAFDPWEH